MEEQTDIREQAKTFEKETLSWTIASYINKGNRLRRKQGRYTFFQVYYSVMLIIYTITQISFKQYFHDALATYLSLILSVVMLVISVLPSASDCSGKISETEETLRALRKAARELDEPEKLPSVRQDYIQIMRGAERRADIDFFRTWKGKCREEEVYWLKLLLKPHTYSGDEKKKQLIEYIRQVEPFRLMCLEVFEVLGDIVLFILPLVIFVFCFVAQASGWMM